MRNLVWDSNQYHSELSLGRDMAYLNLRVKTFFDFTESRSFHGIRRFRPYWTEDKKKEFAHQYKSNIEKVWSNRIWLVTNEVWDREAKFDDIGHAFSIKPIQCGVTIDLVANRSNANQVLEILGRNEDKTDSYGGYMKGIGAKEGFLFADANVLINRLMPDGQIYSYYTATHEFGHFLGLNHYGAEQTSNRKLAWDCTISFNSPHCQSFQDAVGLGTNIMKEHARPWLNRIKRHLEYGNKPPAFSVSLSRPAQINYGVLEVGPS